MIEAVSGERERLVPPPHLKFCKIYIRSSASFSLACEYSRTRASTSTLRGAKGAGTAAAAAAATETQRGRLLARSPAAAAALRMHWEGAGGVPGGSRAATFPLSGAKRAEAVRRWRDAGRTRASKARDAAREEAMVAL